MKLCGNFATRLMTLKMSGAESRRNPRRQVRPILMAECTVHCLILFGVAKTAPFSL